MTVTQFLAQPAVGQTLMGAAVTVIGWAVIRLGKFVKVQIQTEEAHQQLLASEASSHEAAKLHTDTSNFLDQLDHFSDIVAGDLQTAFGAGTAVLAGDPAKAKEALGAAVSKIKALGGADLPTQLEALLGIGETVAADYLEILVKSKLVKK